MHEFVSFNHEILPTKDIKINAISSISLYGKGIFTTIAIYNSKPFLWEKHWQRLKSNAKKIGVDVSTFDREQVELSLAQLIRKNAVVNGRCRLTFFDESSSKIWQISTQKQTSCLIQTADFKAIREELSVEISDHSINSNSYLSGIKSCNYLENILALEDGIKRGFDEMIRYNEKGEVTSYCMANIFWLEHDDEKLYTPTLETGCLAGTTRELILENFEVEEVKIEIDLFLTNAKTVFLTSSGAGIKRVNKIKNVKKTLRTHKILNLIEYKIKENQVLGNSSTTT